MRCVAHLGVIRKFNSRPMHNDSKAANMDEQSQDYRILFRLLGVPFTITLNSWQFLPPKLVIGLFIAWVTRDSESAWLAWGIIYGLLLVTVLFFHILGHILISKLVSPPMTEARITPILIQTLYNDTPDTPATAHLIRSLGGPLMNILLGFAAFLALTISTSPVLFFLCGANFILAFFVLLPLPGIDGEVIWREIARLLKR